MSAPMNKILTILKQLPKALLVVAALSAPILAMTGLRAGETNTIEQPTMGKSGAGFVLMVSLQRA